MKTDQQLASQAASLRAGVAATVVIVIVCFAAAFALADNDAAPARVADNASPSPGAEKLRAAR